MKRILFVDDEPSILDALQNLLRRERKRWDMVFALGGDKALEAMAVAPFDVVMSDMRMPGMDGAELLTRVRELYPATARFVLSGQSGREAVVRALGVTHQFLSKPCEVEVLRGVVERACESNDELGDELLRRVVGRLECLPSVPSVYAELREALAREDVGVQVLASIVERDPALSLKCLQLVNSAYFGLARPTASVARAVSFLGAELLSSLADKTGVFAPFSPTQSDAFSIEAFQRKSLAVAKLAARLVPERSLVDEAAAAGMLLDVGELVIAVGLPDAWSSISRWRAGGDVPEAADRRVLAVSHSEVGVYLLGLWGLPRAIIQPVAEHHAGPPIPGAPGARPVEASTSPAVVRAVRLADRLVREACGEQVEMDEDLAAIADQWREEAQRLVSGPV
ncbi:MAG: HDOD domain-containing protein [Deltaproteobacteria bacterium]|nr:HDOD domain-containing protein [Deltaproteobacteria bacterium]